MNRYYHYIRLTLILIPVVLLAFLLYKDFNPSGQLKVNYDFCSPTPFISEFSPHGRVLDINKMKGECTQAMVIDPVYFDVRLPQKFDSAKLTVWYGKKSATKLLIGPAVNLALWQWDLISINSENNNGNWQLGNATYDLRYLKLDNNNLRFLISSPGLDTAGERIIFKKLEIQFQKERLNSDNWPWRLKDWLKASRVYQIVMR